MAISPAKKDASPKGAGVCIQMKSLAIHLSHCDKVLQSLQRIVRHTDISLVVSALLWKRAFSW